MKGMGRRATCVGIGISLLFAISACTKTRPLDSLVMINYRLMGVCMGINDNVRVGGSSDETFYTLIDNYGPYFIYHLESIQNTGRDAKDFTFHRYNVYINPDGRVADENVRKEEQFKNLSEGSVGLLQGVSEADVVVKRRTTYRFPGQRLIVKLINPYISYDEAAVAQPILQYNRSDNSNNGSGVLLVSGPSHPGFLGPPREPQHDRYCDLTDFPRGGLDPKLGINPHVEATR